ncbi:MAG: hypothetical protein JW995_09125 [Melioribacteraceae bacterium]|nr:hypothetical protein [Melioribacteraceae bacterium]
MNDKYIVMDLSKKSFIVSENNKIELDLKSPFLAGLFSFLLPGAGEFYSESYIKSAIFIAIEAAAIYYGLSYNKKGDDQTLLFENYANVNWDAAKYARWTIDNIDHLNNKIGANVNPEDYSDLFYDQDTRTQVNWDVLNQLESDIGGWYSHRLDKFGEQQYYEMIGKYPQFNPGWNDFDENSLFTYVTGQKDPVTRNFDYYSGLRGKANDYYNIASKAVIVIVTNHIISAIDAAWSASRYNKNVSVNMSIEKQQVGYYTEYFPQLNLKIGL